MLIAVNQGELTCGYDLPGKADVEMSFDREVMQEILSGRSSFQKAFMGGSMKMKGDFNLLRALDQVFLFG